MFSKSVFPLFLISAFTITACDTAEDESVPASSDVSYSKVTMLGTNVNDSAAIDAGPEISFNGLELYFHSNRTGGLGGLDLYVSKRASTNDSWGPAISLGATINTASDDRAASLSKDGLTLIIASDRAGGEGLNDLYESTRTTLTGDWSTPVNLGNVVNTAFNESGADLKADGLLIFFHSDRPGGLGGDDLYATSRVSAQHLWETPIHLGTNVNSSDFDTAPEAASDLLTLYFHSTRIGGAGSHNIWRATRASITDIWGVPVLLPAPVNSTAADLGVSLSSDWKTLYFASDFGGDREIWQAEP